MLKKLKKHALIIAAGSSTQALLKNGITPHLIISMDGSEPNYRAFKNLNLKGVPLLFSPIIKYKILDEVETDYIICSLL